MKAQRQLVLVTLALTWLLFGSLSVRADALAKHDCFANEAMMRIRGCTKLLESNNLDPATRSTAYATRALGLSVTGRYSEAVADYDRALRIIPDYPVALNNRAWALFKLGRISEAAPDVERSLQLDPTSPHAYDTRAHIRQHQGRTNAAFDDYQCAMRLGGSRMVKLYQCGLAGSGHYLGAQTGIITEQLENALKQCAKSKSCDPLPPDEECKAATS